jgi:hypothetical protein
MRKFMIAALAATSVLITAGFASASWTPLDPEIDAGGNLAYVLQHGKRYCATLELRLLSEQVLYSNGLIGNMFASIKDDNGDGFSDIRVSGSNGERAACGVWGGEDGATFPKERHIVRVMQWDTP